jgi:uncharacterized small protein (DUF1192 family)
MSEETKNKLNIDEKYNKEVSEINKNIELLQKEIDKLKNEK